MLLNSRVDFLTENKFGSYQTNAADAKSVAAVLQRFELNNCDNTVSSIKLDTKSDLALGYQRGNCTLSVAITLEA